MGYTKYLHHHHSVRSPKSLLRLRRERHHQRYWERPRYPGHSMKDRRSREKSYERKKSFRRYIHFKKHAHMPILRYGDLLNDRYEILDAIGEGTTARVVKAWDREKQLPVVIKIQKASDKKYIMQEIEILSTICEKYASEDISIIRLLDHFEHEQTYCMVFEQGIISLWDYMKQKAIFCLYDVQHFGKQILQAASQFHALSITHTDIKPENLVFVWRREITDKGTDEYKKNQNCSLEVSGAGCLCDSQGVRALHERCGHESDVKELKFIDFGLAAFETSYHPLVVGTRAYSPPEIVLELGWSMPLDIWGIACVLVEMYAGRTLFRCSDDVEQLELFQRTLGPLPAHMIGKSKEKFQRWFSDGRVRWPEFAPHSESIRNVNQQMRLQDIFHPDDHVFYDLISKMLQYDPKDRITAAQALEHPFFTTPCACTCGLQAKSGYSFNDACSLWHS